MPSEGNIQTQMNRDSANILISKHQIRKK